MSFIIKKNIWDLKASLITDEKFFNSRRKILKNLVKGSVLYAGFSSIPQSAFGQTSSYYPPKVNDFYKVSRSITEENFATTYTNFYEFGSSKNIWRRAAQLKTKPWTLTIDGLVKKPLTLDVDDLLKKIERDTNAPLFTYSYPLKIKKLFAPSVHKALSDKKLTSIASKSLVAAPPAEPVIQVL